MAPTLKFDTIAKIDGTVSRSASTDSVRDIQSLNYMSNKGPGADVGQVAWDLVTESSPIPIAPRRFLPRVMRSKARVGVLCKGLELVLSWAHIRSSPAHTTDRVLVEIVF
jgi:hypothetical protein